MLRINSATNPSWKDGVAPLALYRDVHPTSPESSLPLGMTHRRTTNLIR